jgi:acyl-coenzyme A thioesterase PaaI-like protein
MPLNPVIGVCNPTRPDVQLRYRDGEVVGTATFTRRFTGPPGFTHGGISAMLADQIVAVTGGALGTRCITKAVHVRFRRPLPLDEPVELWGACDMSDPDNITARYTIKAGGEIAVEGTAELVTFERLAERNEMPSTR